MEDSLSLSTSVGGKTKDDIINQAHAARQARELARRKEVAATTIQSFFKMAMTRKRFKDETKQDLVKLLTRVSILNDTELLLLLKKVMFFCDPNKDRSCFDSLLAFTLTEAKTPGSTNRKVTDIKETLSLLEDVIRESMSTTSQCDPGNSVTYHQNDDIFIDTVQLGLARSDDSFQQWTSVIESLLNICLDYIKDATSTRLDSQHIDTYLKFINLFTYPTPVNPLEKISKELLNKVLLRRKSFFRNITLLIYEKVNRFRNDLKASILDSYTRIVTFKLLNLGDPPQLDQLTKIKQQDRKESVDILTKMLSVPGFVHMLDKHTPQSLNEINNYRIFTITVRLLLIDQDILKKLDSAQALCLLANLIHLAWMNEEEFASERMSFVALVTEILKTCQKNMADVSSAITSGNPKLSNCLQVGNKKKHEPRDVLFNPVLGWLVREQPLNMDKDVIKSQLSHLWSKKFLMTLLKDLKKENEKIASTEENGFRCQSTRSDTKSSSDVSPQSLTASFFRRFAEGTARTVGKTILLSHPKAARSPGNSGCSKLISPEAKEIASVCLMLHSTLRTLTFLKQDILTGLCMHDYLVVNLWTFIKSLGPQNGLKAFLEHLSRYTKTEAPEFHILTLFCDCASHIISILDDSELYEKQKPFNLDDLVAISSFFNIFVFRIIQNDLIPCNKQPMDPVLQATHRLLTDLYKRDCRRRFSPLEHWLIKDIKMSGFLKDLEAGKSVARSIMFMLPHIIPHKERVLIFRRLVAKDKAQYCNGPSTLITINRSRIVEDGYQQLIRLPPHALKGLIRVKFINDHGLDEAGIDQDGVFKEFLEDTIKRVFDPTLNLFCSTSEQRLYPSPTSKMHEDHLSLFNFVGKMLGKAVYEGIVVDVPFATFFLSRLLGQPQNHLYSPIDELPSLDPELYKSLTYIKHYEGDVSELDLTFSIDQDYMGKIETYELETGGRSIPVTRESRVRYIHSVANFHMKTQIEKQTDAFVSGFKSIINLEWLSMFSSSEFQRLVSGDNTPIDLQDLRRHTKYFGGFHNNHRVICWLWDVLEKDFTAEEHKLFLKFVTSCSKPPLLGFANVEPPFTIRCVEVSDDQDPGDTVGSVLRGFFAIRRSDPVDRLPTSSTCFNLLKLPNYQRRSTLREKLRYAIKCNPGFELS